MWSKRKYLCKYSQNGMSSGTIFSRTVSAFGSEWSFRYRHIFSQYKAFSHVISSALITLLFGKSNVNIRPVPKKMCNFGEKENCKASHFSLIKEALFPSSAKDGKFLKYEVNTRDAVSEEFSTSRHLRSFKISLSQSLSQFSSRAFSTTLFTMAEMIEKHMKICNTRSIWQGMRQICTQF